MVVDGHWLPDSACRLTPGNEMIDVANAVRVLGVVVTPDLSLNKHVTAVSSKCFFQLHQFDDHLTMSLWHR